MENFIKIYKVDETICDDLIKYYKKNKEYKGKGLTGGDIEDTSIKDSTDVYFYNPSNDKSIKKFFKILSEKITMYCTHYDLNESLITSLDNYLQHYKPGGGFKIWHYENTYKMFEKRKLVYMLYLNTVKNGGTEWKFQKYKTEAIKGNLVIWPAGFTHTHKGIICNQEKYIATGWFESAK